VYPKTIIRGFLILALLAAIIQPAGLGQAVPPQSPLSQSSEVTAYELIIAMNTLRVSFGLPALIEDPIINAVAQNTAAIMAANQSSWHIGNVSGRIAAAGYGGGAKVWATENFAVGGQHTIDTIMVVWADESHMIPAVNPAYCHVGAGTAKSSNGMTYYVLQAAYVAGKSCGEYRAPGGSDPPPGGGGTGGTGSTGGVPQIIVPVKIATAGSDGNIYHIVQQGQSFWAIAVTYQITIRDLEIWNNLSKDSKLQIGQRLLIPGKNTVGYATPTPVGMFLASTPDADGKIIHEVQSHQTLSTIAKAYQVDIDRILSLNGIKIDWPLQIGQKLLIHPGNVTPTATPRPLSPIEKLTPESDGKYYHTVLSGENLSWIASLYEIQVVDLMNWNGLNNSSVLRPDQKLVLQVTPPPTITPTPGPATATATATRAVSTPTWTAMPSPTETANPSPAPISNSAGPDIFQPLLLVVGLAAGGAFFVLLFARKKQ
jgi:LysM repeat protein